MFVCAPRTGRSCFALLMRAVHGMEIGLGAHLVKTDSDESYGFLAF